MPKQTTTKQLNCVIKSFSEAEDDTGSFTSILSTPDLDHDGEIMDTHTFTLPPDMPIYVDHYHDTAKSLVARAVPSFDPMTGNIMVTGKYSRKQVAQEVRQDVLDGIITSMSIGVSGVTMNHDAQGVPHIQGGTVYEGSFTGLPSNSHARVTAAKSGARNANNDQKAINSIHDLSVQVGADCTMTDSGKEMDVESQTTKDDYLTQVDLAELQVVLDDIA